MKDKSAFDLNHNHSRHSMLLDNVNDTVDLNEIIDIEEVPHLSLSKENLIDQNLIKHLKTFENF